MNLFAYYSPDFFTSEAAPVCGDGDAGGTIRTGAIRWERAIGFTDLDDLVSKLRQEQDVRTLGILCHGRPGGLRLLANSAVLNIGDISTYGTRFQAIGRSLSTRGRTRPSIVFLACSSAAESQGTELFERLSIWIPDVLLIAFTRLLSTDGITPRDLGDGRICLPPDVNVTEQEYDASREILAQEPGESREGWSAASASSPYAVRFLNGRQLGSGRTASLPPGFFRPTTSHFGRSSSAQTPGVLS